MKQEKLNSLQSELERLEKKHGSKVDVKANQEIKKRNKINYIYSEEIKKKLMYLKQSYYEAGSKSAKLLAYRLKKQQANNNIYKIREQHKKLTRYKTEDIQSCFEAYYQKLYAQPKIKNNNQVD